MGRNLRFPAAAAAAAADAVLLTRRGDGELRITIAVTSVSIPRSGRRALRGDGGVHGEGCEDSGVEELTVEERNLLSVAYKNVIGARRASWRIISSIEQKEESRGNEDHASVIKEYRGKIETELRKICDGILKLLDSHLIPSSTAAESEGGIYLSEVLKNHFKTGAERKEAAESTLVSYKSAQDIALAELAPTHPIRLGLALHFSVFYYEIVNTPDRACSLAKQV
ncbi:hypothetical protein MUK42_30592 [Musa troglodytarum]|uniref:14-3-3 domain-containing protein n=1 Tax=Musa troglodytarum TaxID=320322 RepID=A0A9E7GHH9_9LILI|nr:hypothetical protein MUK42_30592 [Musa troglodytarum]